jgi:hypothetical protein
MRKVCYAIVGKTRMHMSEMCVCEDADVLKDELWVAREDNPDEDFQIVPLYTLRRRTAEQKMHPTLGESAASDSESKPAPKRVI